MAGVMSVWKVAQLLLIEKLRELEHEDYLMHEFIGFIHSTHKIDIQSYFFYFSGKQKIYMSHTYDTTFS